MPSPIDGEPERYPRDDYPVLANIQDRSKTALAFADIASREGDGDSLEQLTALLEHSLVGLWTALGQLALEIDITQRALRQLAAGDED